VTDPSHYVHGSTDAREIARLEKQGDWTAAFTFSAFDAAAGMRVLDLATGVGAMAHRLVAAYPGISLVGVDLSAQQLAAARANHRVLPLARADATRLPFADATFDRVHCSWLLEHVPDPVAVLREVRRVLKNGAYCQFIEVDNASFRITPDFAEVTATLRALNEAQQRAGGNPFVGQVLGAYFENAGFSRFSVEPRALVGSHADPAFLATFIDEFAEILEGLDESLGSAMVPTIETAAAQIRSLANKPDGEMRYVARLAKGWR
jgi:ubiquinone/menaquinone biosynthesis C-methylase UbiE